MRFYLWQQTSFPSDGPIRRKNSLWMKSKGYKTMEALKSWAVTVCLAALAAGMAGMIAPKGNLEKVYKFTLSLFFLCCVLTPLFQIRNIRLHLELPSTSSASGTAIEETVMRQKRDTAKENIDLLIQNTCERQGVKPLDVDTTVTMNKDGTVSLGDSEITVRKSDVARGSELEKTIRSELGISATIKAGDK